MEDRELEDLVPDDVLQHVEETDRLAKGERREETPGFSDSPRDRNASSGDFSTPFDSTVISGGSSSSSRMTLELQVTLNLGEDIAKQIADQVAGPLRDYFDRLGADVLFRVREKLDHMEDMIGSMSPEDMG